MGSDKNHLKITVVGDGHVGKTCMLIVYTSKIFPTEYVPTVFENYNEDITVDNETYSVSLWDTAGQEDYERLRPLSYPKTDCFILCYAVDSKASFENVLHKWYPELRHFKPDIPIILVATKTDLRETATDEIVTTAQGKKMKRKIRATKYMECSAKLQQGLDDVFLEAVRSSVNPKGTKHSLFKSCLSL